MQSSILIFEFIILYASLVIHEVSHGLMAYKLGDPTAKIAGRLTLNPIKHLDLFGSIILPLTLLLFKSPFIIGYAKPVPFNPLNFKNIKRDTCLVALAGPLANILLGLLFIFLTWIMYFAKLLPSHLVLYKLFIIIIQLNFLWGFFNLLGPFPPFDGSHLVMNLLPDRFNEFKFFLLRNGLLLSLIYLFLFTLFIPPINFLIVHLLPM